MCERFEWTYALTMNVAEVDRQHRELFDFVNHHHKAIHGHAEKEQIEDVLSFLVSYVAVHFADEEKIMDDNGYPDPDRKTHVSEHAVLARTIAGRVDEIRAGNSSDVESLVIFQEEWLINHALHLDLKLAHWLRLNRRVFQILPD